MTIVGHYVFSTLHLNSIVVVTNTKSVVLLLIVLFLSNQYNGFIAITESGGSVTEKWNFHFPRFPS